LISDSYKGITIQYNHLNLPEKVTKGSETIAWLYDAAGTKLQKKTTATAAASVGGLINLIVNDNPIPSKLYQATTITASGKATSGNVTFTAAQSIELNTGFEATPTFFANIDATPIAPTPTTTTQDYTGGIEYKNNVLEAMYHAEGRAYRSGTTWQYEYTLKDHLGNSRVTFRDKNGVAEILQENHYYPFGMNQEGNWLNNAALPDTKYQYNGKELNEDLGLNWYNYGARMYDPVINRFTGVDPLADKFAFVTTYNYAENSPVTNFDLHGLQAVRFDVKQWNNSNGQLQENVKTTYNDKESGAVTTLQNLDTGQTSSFSVSEVTVTASKTISQRLIEAVKPMTDAIRSNPDGVVMAVGATLENTGDAMGIAGALLTPLAPEVGIPLGEAGGIISDLGAVMQGATELKNGKFADAATRAIIEGSPMPFETQMGKVIEKSGTTDISKTILEQQTGLGGYILEKSVESQQDKIKDGIQTVFSSPK
jgi:RHS repeat-associated protein